MELEYFKKLALNKSPHFYDKCFDKFVKKSDFPTLEDYKKHKEEYKKHVANCAYCQRDRNKDRLIEESPVPTPCNEKKQKWIENHFKHCFLHTEKPSIFPKIEKGQIWFSEFKTFHKRLNVYYLLLIIETKPLKVMVISYDILFHNPKYSYVHDTKHENIYDNIMFEFFNVKKIKPHMLRAYLCKLPDDIFEVIMRNYTKYLDEKIDVKKETDVDFQKWLKKEIELSNFLNS